MLSGTPPDGDPTPTSKVFVMTFFLACAGAARTRPRARTDTAISASRPSLRPFICPSSAGPSVGPAISWRARSPRPSTYRFRVLEPAGEARVADSAVLSLALPLLGGRGGTVMPLLLAARGVGDLDDRGAGAVRGHRDVRGRMHSPARAAATAAAALAAVVRAAATAAAEDSAT